MVTDDIKELIKGCVAGKVSAQARLYKLYSPSMWPICLRYSDNSDEAQDLLHDGFIKIFEKIGQYEHRGVVEAWMRKVIVNLALEKFRKKRLLFVDSEYAHKICNDDSFESAEQSITATELLDIIAELPPQYKLVFNLYAIEGYSHKEIAEQLQITEGTSKSNLSRARDILKKKVNDYYHYNLSLSK